jgi:hypothetical protein
MQAMEFFIRTLVSASDAIDKGLDPSKASGNASSQEAKDIATNVSSFLGWAMSSISLAATSATTPSSTPQKPRLSGVTGASASPENGVLQDLNARGVWGSASDGLRSNEALLAGQLSVSGRLPGEVDTSSLDKLAGAPGWIEKLIRAYSRRIKICLLLALCDAEDARVVAGLPVFVFGRPAFGEWASDGLRAWRCGC